MDFKNSQQIYMIYIEYTNKPIKSLEIFAISVNFSNFVKIWRRWQSRSLKSYSS